MKPWKHLLWDFYPRFTVAFSVSCPPSPPLLSFPSSSRALDLPLFVCASLRLKVEETHHGKREEGRKPLPSALAPRTLVRHPIVLAAVYWAPAKPSRLGLTFAVLV